MPETKAQNASQNYGSLANSTGPKTDMDSPFYNVMPKGDAHGPLVGPKLQSQNLSGTEPKTQSNNMTSDWIKIHKPLVIILIAGLILAYPAYYLFKKFVLAPKTEPSVLSEEALKKLEQGTQIPGPEPEPLNFKTPKDWQARFFGNELCQEIKQCGDDADPDLDGLKNLDEHAKETDPNNPDSDLDGLADGDEIFVFGTQPGNKFTANDPDYNDAEYLAGGYNPNKKGEKFTANEIKNLSEKMKASGLKQPTASTLKDSLLDIYSFSAQNLDSGSQASSTPPAAENELAGFELTPEAKLDRDTQRSNATKNIAIALVKYFEAKDAYPDTADFKAMFDEVKIYTRVATNPADPINKGMYVYTYALTADKTDFTLSFFSESQGQLIKTKSMDAKKYRDQEQAAIFDDQRKTNLQTLRTALLLYSDNNTGGNADYVFPKIDDYPESLLPQFITEIPKDPKTNDAYEYQVSETFDSFTLKSPLDAPPQGKTGYLCNQEECRYY